MSQCIYDAHLRVTLKLGQCLRGEKYQKRDIKVLEKDSKSQNLYLRNMGLKKEGKR